MSNALLVMQPNEQKLVIETPVVVVVQTNASEKTAEPASFWQTLQSIAFVLILIVAAMTIAQTIASFFNKSQSVTTQAEIAAAGALAAEIE